MTADARARLLALFAAGPLARLPAKAIWRRFSRWCAMRSESDAGFARLVAPAPTPA
jgi:hypothetical protein